VRTNAIIALAAIILIIIASEVTFIAIAPAARSVIIKSYPSNEATLEALRNGEVDLAPIENAAPQTLMQLKNDSTLNVISIPNFGFTYIGMNLRNAPLDNLTFRQAMLYGFDRDNALRNVLAGYGEVLNPSLFSSAYAGLGWKNASVGTYPYDPQKAGALLDTLGYTEASSGIRVNPSTGQQMRTMFILSKISDPESVAAADLFAKDMRAIGLPIISFPQTDVDFNLLVKIEYSFDLYIDTVSTGPAPTWLGNLFAGSNDLYPAPLATNLVGYHNRTFDSSLNQLMTATDSNAARNAAYRCQEQLSMDLPALPVYSQNLIVVTRPNYTQLVPVAGNVESTIAQSLAEATSGTTIVGETLGLSSLNPSLTLSAADLLTLRLVTEPLLESDAKGGLLPGLASDWSLSDNSTKLSIVLRQGIGFSDGDPITAHDLAATIEWLMRYAIPSSPFYSAINQTSSVTEVGDRTVEITLLQPDSLAPNEFANLFVLPANLLPPSNAPLSLLRAGGLASSGPFTLMTFVEGREVQLAYNTLTPSGVWSAPNLANLNGVQSQDFLGTQAGGSQIHMFTQPLSYEGQQIENGTLATQIVSSNGGLAATLQGSYLGEGIYGSTLNLNTQALPMGSYQFATELYSDLPSGAIIQFGEGTLTIHPPLLLAQLIIYLVTFVALVGLVYRARRVPPKRRVKRVSRRPRRKQVSRPRKRR